MKKFHFLLSLLILSYFSISAQEIDSVNQVPFLKFGSANDLFQAHQKSDKYFSASFMLGISHEFLKNNISEKILLGSTKNNSIYALNLRQNGFTPDDLSLSEVDSTDRPYAGTLVLSYAQTSYTNDLNWKYSTAFRLGVSGPLAMVEGVQSGIHTATGSTPPEGWDNQIANSLIIQYGATAERQFLTNLSHLRLGVGGYAELGSFYNYVVGYATVKLGWFNQKIQSLNVVNYRKGVNMNKWQFYLSGYISDRFVFYDGTTQGGLIPFEKSPYTYSWGDYQHNTVQLIYTLTASYKNFQLQYINASTVDRYLKEGIFSVGSIGIIVPIGK